MTTQQFSYTRIAFEMVLQLFRRNLFHFICVYLRISEFKCSCKRPHLELMKSLWNCISNSTAVQVLN